jgi:hypothetical protein
VVALTKQLMSMGVFAAVIDLVTLLIMDMALLSVASDCQPGSAQVRCWG